MPEPQSESIPSIQDRLIALGAEFTAALPGRVRDLCAVCAEIVGQEQAASDTLKSLHDIVHGLAGSAQNFGYEELGAAAAPLDEFLFKRRKRLRPLSPDEKARIESWVGVIVRAAELPPQPIVAPRDR